MAQDPQMAHMVFFTLNDESDEARDRLVRSCHEHLSGHDGTVHFSAAIRAADMQREVNDSEFGVALHLVFESKAAHDAYQTDPRHQAFIEQNKSNWAQVRVFDSYLQ